jgi:uncharacterized protein YmfQ (DUF2313 family)
LEKELLKMKPYHLHIAVIATGLALPTFALASADTPEKSQGTMDRSASPMEGTKPAADTARYSDSARMKQWSSDKKRLEQALRTGQEKAFYRQELERLGYKITAMNQNEPDYLEYEVVKGDNSYEVQVDFDKETKKATKVDVTTNMWKADATERALKDSHAKVAYPKSTTPNAERYSDRARMKAWTSNKERLENSLKVGQPKEYYPAELKKLGYQVTAVNADKTDYAEYEVVKGEDTYEVQVHLDGVGKASKVDVTTNLWKADATDRALEKKSRD